MKKFTTVARVTAIGASLALPIAALAQTASGTGGYCTKYTGDLQLGASDVSSLIKFATCFLLKSIIPLIFALAIAAFIYGVFDFIKASASGEEVGKKKEFLVWGIIALAVMFSVWGLVGILQNTFHVGNVIPQLPVNGQ